MDTKALRQKILDLAIHGKLVPQDPNDKPASVLLERIRVEKERLIKEGKIKKGKKSAKTSDKPHYPFELPKGWEWVTLEDICAKFSTGPFGSMVHKSDYVTANGVPIVNPANIVNGTISSKNIMYISKDKSIELERYKLEVNDIVLARRGDLTKCTIVGNEQVDFICGTGSFFLHLISVLPQYFQLVYMSSYVQIILTTECVGATMNNLNQSVLSQILFPLPPLAEQKRVVARTKYMLSIITTLDNEQYSLHTTIKQAKAKVLDLAIHGKLVPQDPNDEPASELLKRINPKAEITCDTPQYGKLPKGWCETLLGNIGNWQSGATPSRLRKDYYNGDIPWLKTGDLNDSVIKSIPETITRKALKETSVKLNPTGSVLIAMYGATIGKIGILALPATTNQACCACVDYMCDKMFLFYFLLANRKRFVAMGGGGAQPNISKEKITNTHIPLPPLSEQHRIVAKIEELFVHFDKIESSLQA